MVEINFLGKQMVWWRPL